MRKIVVVNLTRFGDLLQTAPTIVGLKEQWPDAETTVVVEQNFADVCRGLPAVDRVWPLDLDALGRLMLPGDADGLHRAYHVVEDVVHALRAERFDLALNYSSSRMSAILLRLIEAKETRGWTMSADGFRLITSPWSRLFSAACLTRRQAPFNLVDYYKRTAGVTAGPRRLFFDVPSTAEARAAELLAAGGWDGRAPLVAFQLGASRPVRRWPAASFVSLGKMLNDRIGATLVLCGGGGEKPFAAEIGAALGARAVDVCGRTSIAELAAVLRRCDVLVTPDTGPMHLAVAVDTPVVAMFFGPALPVDTGPYAPDQLCLHAAVACAPCEHSITCLEPFCKDVLAPAAIADAVVARRASDWTAIAAAADRWPALAWYRTRFDADGLFDLERLGRGAPSRLDVLRAAYRGLFQTVLVGSPPRRPAGSLPAEAATVRAFVALAEKASAQAAVVERLASGGDLAALDEAARALELLDVNVFRQGAMHEALTLLVQTFRFEKESLENEDLAVLATRTRRFHDDLVERARLLAALLGSDPTPQHHTEEEAGHASHA